MPFYTKNFIEKVTNFFNRAKQLVAGDEKILRRVERAELPILYVKCWRGPRFAGATYADDVAEFERIGRREGLRGLSEGRPNFESVLVTWKKRFHKSALALP